jgi:hypothetical protein
MRRLLLAGLLAAFAATAGAQDRGPFGGQDPGNEPDAPAPGGKDASTPLFLKAMELVRKGAWKEAQKAFAGVLEKYPDSVHKADCEARGGKNCYMGTEKIHESGPPGRRIDVAVMGDGFTHDKKDQDLEYEWAKLCLTVLWSEGAFAEYKDYFNYYYVRLVSKDEGVDKPMSDEEKAKLIEKNRNRKKKKKLDEFDTALDCKAAGPQGQVMADRGLVYQWLDYANRDVPGCGDDGLVIAFARFGQLGMGGGGVANVGRPDKSITVHEFGHAFVGLLDEYANNPGPPGYAVRAPNATSDPKFIPWQHFLDRKVKGVDVLEGGATYKKGVWRPAPTCAMNAAGASGYCPVCREAAVLRIYSYVSPIDTTTPAEDTEIRCVAGDGTTISIVPMRPATHDLRVEWFFERVMDSEPGPKPKSGGETSDLPIDFDGWNVGTRGQGRPVAYYEATPPGVQADDLAKQEKKGARVERHVFQASELPRGRYVVTARVVDPCEWVLKDDKRLLEERATWWVTVQPKR